MTTATNDPVLAAMDEQLHKINNTLRLVEDEAERLAGLAEDLEVARDNWLAMQQRMGEHLERFAGPKETARPAAKKPAVKPPATSKPVCKTAPSLTLDAPKQRHKQTWGQWIAVLRKDGIDLPIQGELDYSVGKASERDRFFLECFYAGHKPAAALAGWLENVKKMYVDEQGAPKKEAAKAPGKKPSPKASPPSATSTKPATKPTSKAADNAASAPEEKAWEQKPDARSRLSPEEMGVTVGELEAALKKYSVHPTIETNWKTPVAAIKPLPTKQGPFTVVMASEQTGQTVYELVPVYTPMEAEMEGIKVIKWDEARKREKGHAGPETVDVLGVEAFDDADPPQQWVLGSRKASGVFVVVPKKREMEQAIAALMEDPGVDNDGVYHLAESIEVLPSEWATHAQIEVVQSSVDQLWRSGHLWQGPLGNGGSHANVYVPGVSTREYAISYQASHLLLHLRNQAKQAKNKDQAEAMKLAVKAAEAFLKSCQHPAKEAAKEGAVA